ncbi:MAG: peptide deformylase [Pseudomonadota bacterium]
MTLRKILRWPYDALGTVCSDVDEITPDIRILAQDMLDTMYAAPGRGLAAPQVGVLKRLFVMDVDWKEGARDPQVFLNPVILERSDTLASRFEGCLSIPGVTAELRRPERVRLRWTALNGAVEEADFDGFASACVQHEIDHLDGIVTLDRLDADARARVLKVYAEVPA